MDYFIHYPLIEYSDSIVINLMIRNKVREYVLNNIAVYEYYILNDDERPDILADRYYGDYKYTWLIFYANDIFDPVRDWLLNSQELIDFVNYKYALEGDDRTGFEIANQTIHEFRNRDNLIVDFDSWYFDVYDDMYTSFIEQPSPYDTYFNNPLIEGAIARCTTGSGESRLIGLHYRSTDLVYSGYITEFNTFKITSGFNSNDLKNQIVKLYNASTPNNAYYYKVLQINGQYITLGTELRSEFFSDVDGIQTVFNLDNGALIIDSVRVWIDGEETTAFTFLSNAITFNDPPPEHSRVDVSMYGEMDNIQVSSFNQLELSSMYFQEGDIILSNDYNPNQILNTGVNIGEKNIVTKWDYENILNEAKREIKLIESGYADQLLQEFRSLLKP